MIKIQIIGHLGKDCTTNNVSGKTVMNFNVAHSEKYKDAQGNQKDKTTWADCAYWSDRTAVAPYLKKGTLVYVEGTPEVRTYPKNDGTTGALLTIRVTSVQLLGGKDNSQGSEPATQQSSGKQQPAGKSSEIDDDLPF